MARIGIKQLTQLLRRVGTSLQAGVDVRKVWKQEADRAPADRRQAMQRISRRVSGGSSAAEAMTETRAFPPLVCEMVDVGERTGRLDEVLLRLADHYDHLLEMRRMFLGGIAWPMIQLSVAVLVVGLLIWIVGAIAPMTGGEPVDLLGLGLVGNRGLFIYVCLVGSVVTGLVLLVTAVRRGWLGAGRLVPLLMHVPGLGNYLQTTALARLSWTLELALESGVDARRSMRMALGSTQNEYYTAHQERADQVILRGGEFHEALRGTGAFPDEFLHALEAAELAGTQTESLRHLSSTYEQRAKTASAVLTVLATAVTWGLVGALLIALIFRLAMFYIGTLYEALEGI